MIESDEKLLCPPCRKPVFTDPMVLRCQHCGEFQHEACAAKGGRCGVNESCKGKPERCAVVRVPHAGPTRHEIAASVDDLVQRTIEPLAAKLDAQARTLVEQRRGVETEAQKTREEVGAAGAKLETALGTLDTTLQTILRVSKEIYKRTLYRPKTLNQAQVEKSVEKVADRLEQLAETEGERAVARLALLRAQLVPDLRAAVRAIEACRFDVVSARHPAPWDTSADDVLAPVASTDFPREDVS
jgi:hypothetical protein